MDATPEDEGDETASIDLAVGFFCSVLVLFVFIEFNVADTPRTDVTDTLGQTEQTVEMWPSAWSAVNQRGSFAVWQNTGLTLLDLGVISEGVIAAKFQYQGENGFQSLSVPPGSAPNSFHLTLNFVISDIPLPWQREVVTWNEDACFKGSRSLLTVFVPRETRDVARLLAFGQRCGLRLRLEPAGALSSDGRTEISFALSQGAYSAERMFR